MARSLIGSNKSRLVAVLVANVVLFYAVVKNDAIFAGDWVELLREITKGIPSALGLVLIGILNAQLSAEAKSRIVFMRWKNPLPGCGAFTRYARNEPTVDIKSLEATYGPLPTEPHDQNILWYKLYYSVQDEPAVSHVHREYLFSRDYAGLALMMLVVLGIAGFLQIPSWGTALGYLALLLVQFVLTSRAARIHGRQFVVTVLARKSVGLSAKS